MKHIDLIDNDYDRNTLINDLDKLASNEFIETYKEHLIELVKDYEVKLGEIKGLEKELDGYERSNE